MEDPMLGPNHLIYGTYGEPLTHAARIRMVQNDRQNGTRPFHADGHRLITARRLAAG